MFSCSIDPASKGFNSIPRMDDVEYRSYKSSMNSPLPHDGSRIDVGVTSNLSSTAKRTSLASFGVKKIPCACFSSFESLWMFCLERLKWSSRSLISSFNNLNYIVSFLDVDHVKILVEEALDHEILHTIEYEVG